MPVSTEERPSRQTVLERAERRERIAARVLAGMYASGEREKPYGIWAGVAVHAADLLMAELDRRRAAELEEARS